MSTLVGPNLVSSGIWSEDANHDLKLVARQGGRAPGTEAGVVFNGFTRGFGNFSFPYVLNGSGQIAFQGHLLGNGIDYSNDRGIWAEDVTGQLLLIAQEGDILNIDSGLGADLRVIDSLGFAGNSGNEDGRRSGFNDLGQVAFRARFTDGTSGIFVSDLVANLTHQNFAGDFDEDDDVDGNDFLKWQRGESPNQLSQSDLTLWESYYGESEIPLATSAAVPEPSSLLLFTCFSIFAVMTRMRQPQALEMPEKYSEERRDDWQSLSRPKAQARLTKFRSLVAVSLRSPPL